jgi:trans-aconitate methyltransferase
MVDHRCGTGELAAVLARRWPNARVVRIGSSGPKLERARARFPVSEWPCLIWQEESIEYWRPLAGVDPAEREQFESELATAYATAYPDGTTVLPFSSIFIVRPERDPLSAVLAGDPGLPPDYPELHAG